MQDTYALMNPARKVTGWAAVVCAGYLSASTAYLLVLLAAAAGRRQAETGASERRLRLLVLVPAHNEAAIIGDTLASLKRADYPAGRLEAVVVADNCRDRTADVARAAGATVLERFDAERRGKGFALAWALEHLAEDPRRCDAVVFLDADCEPSPNLLTSIAERMEAGAEAVQAGYVVANPGESWTSALRFAAFALMNVVRPSGKGAMGLSCGILGTGFGLTRELLRRRPWESFSLSEDVEYHLRLVAAGERVWFAHEASVRSSMPTSLRTSREQNLRWEGGKWQLVRAWTPRLVRAGVRRRDPVLVHAGLELLVPPQSLLFAGNALLGLAAAAGRSSALVKLALANLLGQGAYVLGGMVLVGAPRSVYRALMLAPLLAAWKVGLQARLALGRGPKGWVATRSPGGSSRGDSMPAS